MKNLKTQVKKEHYYNNYDNYSRQLSYLTQYNLISNLKPNSILEIGVGNSFLTNLLKNKKFNVTTADYDKSLNPDIVCDIRDIPVKNKTYDIAVAFQILEHLEYNDSLKALKELKRVAKKNIIISVPYSCIYFEFIFNFGLPYFDKSLSVPIRIPNFFISGKYGNKEHYWELGRKGYSKKRFFNDIKKLGLKINKAFHISNNKKHFFIHISI